MPTTTLTYPTGRKCDGGDGGGVGGDSTLLTSPIEVKIPYFYKFCKNI